MEETGSTVVFKTVDLPYVKVRVVVRLTIIDGPSPLKTKFLENPFLILLYVRSGPTPVSHRPTSSLYILFC